MISIDKSLYAHFQEFAAECANHRFLFDENRSYTALETFHEIIAIGNKLHDYGVKAGSIVVLRSTRSLDTYLIYLALEFLGATVAMANPHQTAEEFLRKIDVSIKVDFFISNECAGNNTSAQGNWMVLGYGTLEVCYPARCEEQRFLENNDVLAPATIFFTSGSTGVSKGAVINQRALVQRALDIHLQGIQRSDDIALAALPLHYGFGVVVVLTAFLLRYSLFFPSNNRTEYVLECIERYKITCIDEVPSYFYSLAKANEVERRDVSSLRMGFASGAPMIPEQHLYIEEALGMMVHPQYAMSECVSISNTLPSDSAEIRRSTVGKPHRNSGYILDRNGIELPIGQEGEICFSGTAVMCGYYGNEEETKNVFDSQGRFHTGDLGYIDEKGNLHISGRLKDIIIRNGINLVPKKIEEKIRSLPEVEQVVIVGVPDKKLGEAPCALVVLKKDVFMNEEELKAKLSLQIPKNEIPVNILFADSIPLNQIGKPNKKKVKEMFQKRQ